MSLTYSPPPLPENLLSPGQADEFRLLLEGAVTGRVCAYIGEYPIAILFLLHEKQMHCHVMVAADRSVTALLDRHRELVKTITGRAARKRETQGISVRLRGIWRNPDPRRSAPYQKNVAVVVAAGPGPAFVAAVEVAETAAAEAPP